MAVSLRFIMLDTQQKLGRTLKEDEVDFLKWMITKQKEQEKKYAIAHK